MPETRIGRRFVELKAEGRSGLSGAGARNGAEPVPVGRYGGDILYRLGERFAMLTVTDGEEEVLYFGVISKK